MKNLTEYEKKLVNWLRSEFKNRMDLVRKKEKIYQGLCKKYPHILDTAWTSLKRKHTLQSCKKIAKKFKNRKEWSNTDSSSYNTARINGWLDECLPKILKWDDPVKILNEAKKYNYLTDWKNKSSGSYDAALNLGILDYIKNKVKFKSKITETYGKKIYCINNKKTYNSIKEAARILKLNPVLITGVLKGRTKSTGGYTFKYVEE